MKKTVTLLLILFTAIPGFSKIVKKPIPDKLVVLTFDDATASQYSVVAPLLKEYGFGATFFICEFPPNFADTTKYMNWRQIQKLDQMGFEIANHTRNHPAIAKLSNDKIIDTKIPIKKTTNKFIPTKKFTPKKNTTITNDANDPDYMF